MAYRLISFLLACAVALPLQAAVDGTTGTPLGGLGTGAVKFRAGNGTFTFNDQTPTRYGDYQPLPGAQFQLYTNREGRIVTRERLTARRQLGRILDDAIFPTHTVSFDSTNGISISLRACGAFDPSSPDSMALPSASFEFTFVNPGTSAADISIALQMTTEQSPTLIPKQGFADSAGLHQKCVLAEATEGTAMITAGSGPDFFQTGTCDNHLRGVTNRVAAFTTLAPGGRATIVLEFGWYNSADPARYFYTTIHRDVTAVTAAGLRRWPVYAHQAFTLVDRMRASNLPPWMVDQTLNTLVNIVNNSIYTADGRYCHSEGMYAITGTMDQMWHARFIHAQLMPAIAWKELEYWARSQKKNPEVAGQVHHDVGNNALYAIAAWDDTEYSDYRNIDRWVDLNCGFIISVYETFIATADYDKLSWFWPYVKSAGQRLLTQEQLYGDPAFPFTFATSASSYDAGGDSQAYASGLAMAAFSILRRLAGTMSEAAVVRTYTEASASASRSFSARWLDRPPPVGGYGESLLGGPWISQFLHLGPQWPARELEAAFASLVDYYRPTSQGLGYPAGSYSEWQPYLVAHLGGYALQTGRSEVWKALQFDMYERNTLDRNRVFNQALGIPARVTSPVYEADTASGADQYISMPVLWRNYFDLAGVHRNRASGELWLEPHIPEELDHTLTDVLVVSPEGWATISAHESGDSWQNQRIAFVPDRPMPVDTVYIADRFGGRVRYVKVNGVEAGYRREGSGLRKELKIYWHGEVGPEGILVEAAGNPDDTVEPQTDGTGSPCRLWQNVPNPFVQATTLQYHIRSGCQVRLTIRDLTGREVVRLVDEYKESGSYFYHFRPEERRLPSGVYICELVAGSHAMAKRIVRLK